MTVTFQLDAFTAGPDGIRADHAVRARFPAVDRALALRLLKAGRLRINGSQATLAMRARAGQTIIVDAAADRLGRQAALPGPAFTLLWQSPEVVVVDKAVGVAMHGEEEGGDGDDALSSHVREHFVVEAGLPGPSFPGRLDRATSGLVVACLSRAARERLARHWSETDVDDESKRVLRKEYLCIVHGRAPGEGDLQIPLAARRVRGKNPGKLEDARTTFVTLAQNRRMSVLVCELHTGRMHQIRRHLKAIGHPIVGDPRYGDDRRDADLTSAFELDLMLHAWRLSHDGSVVDLPPALVAPVPERFWALLKGTSIDLADALASASERSSSTALSDGQPVAVAGAQDEDDDVPEAQRSAAAARRPTSASASASDGRRSARPSPRTSAGAASAKPEKHSVRSQSGSGKRPAPSARTSSKDERGGPAGRPMKTSSAGGSSSWGNKTRRRR
jgi:23S rRNA pseudouridine955/2504/2580 synthase